MSSDNIHAMYRKISIQLDPRLHTIIEQIATHRGVSVSSVINAALKHTLDTELPDVDLTLESDLTERLSYEELVQNLQDPP